MDEKAAEKTDNDPMFVERLKIGEEIKTWIKSQYKSITEFSELSGFAYSTLHNWFTGKRSPTYLNIKTLVGYGFIPDLDTVTKPLHDGIKAFNKSKDLRALQEGLDESNAQIKELYSAPVENSDKELWFKFIPSLDTKATIEVKKAVLSSKYEDDFAFNRKWLIKMGLIDEKLSTIYAPDDSMSPVINRGDCVVIHHGQPAIDNKVSLVLHEDKLFLRRMEYDNGNWLAKSDNPMFETFEIAKKSAIIGKAVIQTNNL